MLFSLTLLLGCLSAANSRPSILDTQVNGFSNNGSNLGSSVGGDLPLPPDDFRLKATDGTTFGVEVAQASHLFLNLIFEGWMPSGPPMPAASTLRDPQFDLQLKVLLLPQYAKSYGTLRTPAWIAVRISADSLSDMEQDQSQWQLSSRGWNIMRGSRNIGSCLVGTKTLQAGPEATTNGTSTNPSANVAPPLLSVERRQEDDSAISINNTALNTSSLTTNVEYEVAFFRKGSTVDRKTVLWLLWSYLDAVFGYDAYEPVSKSRKAREFYLSDPLDGVQLQVTYTRILAGRTIIKWIDIVHAFRFVFVHLADQYGADKNWQTFDAVAAFAAMPKLAYLKIQIYRTNQGPPPPSNDTESVTSGR